MYMLLVDCDDEYQPLEKYFESESDIEAIMSVCAVLAAAPESSNVNWSILYKIEGEKMVKIVDYEQMLETIEYIMTSSEVCRKMVEKLEKIAKEMEEKDEN